MSLLEVFFEIKDTLNEMKELMISMNKHLSNLTVPPNMIEWAENRKYIKQIEKFEEENKDE